MSDTKKGQESDAFITEVKFTEENVTVTKAIAKRYQMLL